MSMTNTETIQSLIDSGEGYNVEFKVEDENVLKYVYTLTSDNTLLEKVLMDLEKIAPVKFEYNEDKKEVIVKMK